MVEPIEKVHKNNFRLIKKHNIKVGDEFVHKKSGRYIKITSIHPLYGWVIDDKDSTSLKQDLSNLKEYVKIKKDRF